jgi:hypothetical protein
MRLSHSSTNIAPSHYFLQNLHPRRRLDVGFSAEATLVVQTGETSYFKSPCCHGFDGSCRRHLPTILRDNSLVFQVQRRQQSWPCLWDTTSNVEVKQLAPRAVKVFNRLTLQITRKIVSILYILSETKPSG